MEPPQGRVAAGQCQRRERLVAAVPYASGGKGHEDDVNDFAMNCGRPAKRRRATLDCPAAILRRWL